MDAGEAAATARRLRLNIAPLPQTEWCHHWADVLHNNRPPMWSLFQKIRSIRANRQTGFHVRLGTVVLLDVCARALRLLCVCVHVPSPLYCGSTLFSVTVCVSSFFTLILSSDRGITPQTQSYLSSPLSLFHAKTHHKRAWKLLKQTHMYMWMPSFLFYFRL